MRTRQKRFSAAAVLRERRRVAARRARVRLMKTIGVMALMLMIGSWLGGLSSTGRAIPSELVGMWVSDDPRFAGRALELAPGHVSFHSGTDAIAAPNRIRRIRKRVTADGAWYRIDYVSGGGTARVVLSVSPGAQELMLSQPRDVKWHRSGGPVHRLET